MTEPHDRSPEPFEGEGDGIPPGLSEFLRGLGFEGALPPEVARMLADSGLKDADPGLLAMMGQQVRAMFESSPEDGSLNRDLARDLARKVAASQGDPTPGEGDRAAATEAVTVAGLWLDPVTDLTARGLTGRAWSRAEWVEASMPLWGDLVEPVGEGMADAVGSAMTRQLGQLGEGDLPEGLFPAGVNPAAAMGQMAPMMRRMHGSMFSAQLGQGVGALAGELLTGNEIGLPLVEAPDVVLMPRAIDAFAEGLGIDVGQVRLYLALREVARARLFTDTPWVEAGVTAAVGDYARDITFDLDAIEEAARSIDLSDPESAQAALGDRLFAAEPSPAQRAALNRLETLLALIEGWVDVVSLAAARPHLPQAEALAEAVRRRRASGGPAEKTFASLVGLELRPRRLRDAANLFLALEARGGAEARDRAWSHPDLAPTGADLDDPLGYVERVVAPVTDDVDAELAALLQAETQTPGETETPGEGA